MLEPSDRWVAEFFGVASSGPPGVAQLRGSQIRPIYSPMAQDEGKPDGISRRRRALLDGDAPPRPPPAATGPISRSRPEAAKGAATDRAVRRTAAGDREPAVRARAAAATAGMSLGLRAGGPRHHLPGGSRHLSGDQALMSPVIHTDFSQATFRPANKPNDHAHSGPLLVSQPGSLAHDE